MGCPPVNPFFSHDLGNALSMIDLLVIEALLILNGLASRSRGEDFCRSVTQNDHHTLFIDNDAPLLTMRALQERPTIRAVVQKDRPRPTPAAKKVMQEAVKPNSHMGQVTAQ